MRLLHPPARHQISSLWDQLPLTPSSHAWLIQVFTWTVVRSTQWHSVPGAALSGPGYISLPAQCKPGSGWGTSRIAAWDSSSSPSIDSVQENQFCEIVSQLYISPSNCHIPFFLFCNLIFLYPLYFFNTVFSFSSWNSCLFHIFFILPLKQLF